MDRRHEGTQHEARYNFDLLSLLDLQPPAVLSGSIHLPDGAFHSIAQRLAFPIHSTPFISLHLSAHSPIARWPASSFAALTRWIWTTWGYEVVLIGAERTDPSRAEYLECLGTDASKIHDLTGATSLAALGALLQNAKGLVTRDTGPCHLAAAVGCPVVEIFGRTSPLYGPTRWTALGARVVVVQNPISQNPGESRHQYWKRSFAAISVESVQCALHQLLQS
jgi:ADP-heptose:LPS heptosyltransferase